MKITDNLDLMGLFFSKEVLLFLEDENFSQTLKIRVPIAKDLYVVDYAIALNKIFTPVEKINKVTGQQFNSNYDFISFIIFDLGKYQEYSEIYNSCIKTIDYILPNNEKDYRNKIITLSGVTINAQIWDYVIYVLKYCCGEKVEAPQSFQTKAEEDWYLAQKKMEDRVKNIRQKSNKDEGDKEGLLKVFLSIIYAFPSLTIDYLSNQTMAQIQWLQKYAAESVSYQVNEKVFAAGNMKKGSKLEFFIK